jgi:MFS family permease
LGKGFALLWAGQSVSLIGDQITLIALPLLAVRSLAASTLDVGVLGGCLRLPFLLIGLPAGVWVSRIGLARSMIAADLVRGTTLAVVTALAILGVRHLLLLFVAAVIIGSATVFFQLSYQSFVPELLPDRGRWHAANTRLSLSESSSLLIGPALGGLAVAGLAPSGALLLDVASYAVSVLTLVLLTAPRPAAQTPAAAATPAPRLADRAASSTRRQIVDGWRHVRVNPVLNSIMWTGALYNLGSAMYDALIIVFAVHYLHLGAGQTGLAIGVGGIGFPLGSVLAGPVTRRLGLGPSLIWAAVPSVAGLLVTACATAQPLAFIAAGTFLIGIGQGCFAVSAITLRQLASAPAFRARATAVHRFGSWGTLPVGALLGGLLGQVFGLRTAMLTAAAIAALCSWPLLRSPLRGTRTLPATTAVTGSSAMGSD